MVGRTVRRGMAPVDHQLAGSRPRNRVSECLIGDVHPAGDHALHIAHVDAAAAVGERPMPLLCYSGRHHRMERASCQDIEGKPEG